VVHAPRHQRGVGEEQVEDGRGDPEPDVAEVAPSGHHHPPDDRQLGEDRHHAGRGLVDERRPVVGLDGAGAVGVGGEDPLCRDARQHEQQRVAGAETLQGILERPLLPGLWLVGGRGRRGQVGLLRRRGDDVGQEEDQQRDPQEHEPPGGEVRLQERPPHHEGVGQHPHQEHRGDAEQPDVPRLEDPRLALLAPVDHRDDAGGEEHQAQEVEVPDAPHPVELEEQGDREERREVHPGRGIDLVVLEEDLAHARLPPRPSTRETTGMPA